MSSSLMIAPEIQASAWLNTPQPLSLAGLRGKVIAVYVFQMLCPSCVTHAIPQASALRNAFSPDQLAVIGLHSVFEHHAVMGREALEVFMHEYRIRFPVAIDAPASRGAVPQTMARYQLRGTPSILLIDQEGRLQLSHFGHIDDLRIGAIVGQLVGSAPAHGGARRPEADGCGADACAIA